MPTPATGTFRIDAANTSLTGDTVWAFAGGADMTAIFKSDTDDAIAATKSVPDNYNVVFGATATPDLTAIILNKGTADEATVAFAGLPAGFHVTGVTIKGRWQDSSGETFRWVKFVHDSAVVGSIVTGTLGTVTHSHVLSPVPSTAGTFLATNFGFTTLDAGFVGSNTFKVQGFWIEGTYNTLASTWWYNASTDQYDYEPTTPGTGWAAASVNPTPAITSVKRYTTSTDGVLSALSSPGFGCAGTAVTIAGTGFGVGAGVTFGGVAASGVVVTNQNLITCVAPAHANGAVDVVVTNADALTSTLAGGYTYLTPWWAKTVTYSVDGVDESYTYYVNQCSAPSTGTWTVSSTSPTVLTDPDGWYASTAAYGGDVLVLNSTSRPAPSRKWTDISAWATSNTAMLGGSPGSACVVNNRLIYAADGYTVGTHYPPIRVFDGSFDRELCRLPPTTTDTIPKAIMSMLAANGTVYLSTFDLGTSNTTWVGRVFSLDLASGALTPLGAPFAAGEMPYALCWHMGRLWCGTNNGIGTGGKVYYFRPGIDTAWTADYTLSTSSVGGAVSMCSYAGKLYVGTDNAAASRGKVLVRSSLGAYTTSQTGTGGTAVVNNGYISMAVFGSNLYAAYWNNDATAIAKVEKFDGTTWSTSYTGVSGTLRPFISLVVDDGYLFAIGGGFGLTGVILSTPDGTTWTNLTALLPESNKTLLPAHGVLVI